MENTGNYFLIRHLVLCTGLTDRTIRSYIASGILEGELINGLWHFTPEQAERFIAHPAVRPSILAKQNGTVYDFLSHTAAEQETCMILDLPGIGKKEIAEYFCYHINNDGYQNIHFHFDGFRKIPRVILRGNLADVLQLAENFRKQFPKSTK